jgi:hypothetical protein
MSNEPPNHSDLSAETLELTAFTRRLRKEYAELIETSVELRKESRQLIDDSKSLRAKNNKPVPAQTQNDSASSSDSVPVWQAAT